MKKHNIYCKITAMILTVAALLSTTVFPSFAIGTVNESSSHSSFSEEKPIDNVFHNTEKDTLLYEDEAQLKLEELTKDSAILNYIDAEVLKNASHTERLPEFETLSSYVFKNEDGTRSVYLMDCPVKYINESGEIKDIDLTLRETSDLASYSVTSSRYSIAIGKKYTDGVTVHLENTPITLTALDTSVPGKDTNIKINADAVVTKVDRNAVIYDNLFGNNVEVRYIPLYNGVKEEIVIKEYTGVNSFSFTLSTNGLYVYENSGSYYIAENEDSQNRINIGQTIVYDSKDNVEEGTMSVKTLKSGSLYQITVSAPLDFMLDASTVYPVVIDPELTYSDTENGAGTIEDCPIFEARPTKNHGTYSYDRVGYVDEKYGLGRTAIRLTGLINSSLYTSVSASQINSVTFYVRESSEFTGRTVLIKPLTENSTWTESNLTWATLGAYGETVSQATLTKNSICGFDITQLVKGWKNGTYNASCGFLMMSTDETLDESFCSSEYSNYPQYRPHVVFNYTPKISLYGASYLNENSTTILLTSVQPSDAAVTYTSSNTSVATVSNTGVVTGIRAGKVTITASFTDDEGKTYSDAQSMIILYPNGVYLFENYSRLYLTSDNGISDGTNVMQYGRLTSTTGRFRQMWILKHIGSGYYSVRPMHKPNSALDVTQNNVDIWQIGTTDTVSGVPSYARWTIEYATPGYVFHPNGDETKTLALAESSSSSGVNVISKTYTPNENINRWTFSAISPVPSGIHLYNESEEYIITTQPTKYMAINQTKTLSELNLRVVPYSGNTISQTVTWSASDPSKVSISSSGIVTAVSHGTVTITASRTYLGITDTTSYTLVITEVPNGTYFVKNYEHDRYLQIDDAGFDESGQNAEMHDFDGGTQQRWVITSLDNGYYKITSAQSGYALSVPEGKTTSENVALIQENYTGSTRQQWQITETSNGRYKIKPRSASSSPDLVMAVGTGITSGTNIEQRKYVNDSNYKDEWELLLLGQNITLLGIQDDADGINTKHDHFSCYSDVMASLSSVGINGFNLIDTDYMSNTDCLTQMRKSDIFICRSHGGAIVDTTCIYLYDDDQEASMLHDFQIYDFTTQTSYVDLSNCDLILFVACNTARYEGTSLPYAAVAAGAKAAVGFRDEIDCSTANKWTKHFIEYYTQGYSVETSCDKASEMCDYLDGVDTYVVVLQS